jgi:hypothetical protein
MLTPAPKKVSTYNLFQSRQYANASACVLCGVIGMVAEFMVNGPEQAARQCACSVWKEMLVSTGEGANTREKWHWIDHTHVSDSSGAKE